MRDLLRSKAYRWYEEVWNNGRLDVIPEIRAPNSIAHGLSLDPLHGNWNFTRFPALMRGAMPDMHVAVHTVVVEPPYMANMYTIRGTHTGTALGIPPTRRKVALSGIALCLMPEGMVTESWNAFDLYFLFRQMGVSLSTVPDEIVIGSPIARTPSIHRERPGDERPSYLSVPGAQAMPTRRRVPSGQRICPVAFPRRAVPAVPTSGGILTREAVAAWLEKVWSRGESESAEALQPAGEPTDFGTVACFSGFGGVGRLRSMFKAAFPDLSCHIETIVVEGNLGIARVTCTGTHTGAGLMIPPSGRPFSIEAMYMVEWKGGRISGSWNFVDIYSLLRQIGALVSLVPDNIVRLWLPAERDDAGGIRDQQVRDVFLTVPSVIDSRHRQNT